ncbi:hypothetical protein TrVE_jg1611 [Triparma verrucosa]|uniref:Uncharacterized protein n=2 Tax=Triparma TaxID=722752 RepID=A0A9W7EUW7_9STRA|nr:hypothetical protein TrST_g2460 [Triparma strigata]GMI11623.1 hypothetical protein TrVE_jg1611 [Triparma verrucosa]
MSVQTCKLCLVGNGSVGKTSIVQRFIDDGFKKLYKQTVGVDFLEKTLEFRGVPLKTSVWDIGGQSLSSSNLPNYILGSNIIFLCYDVTDPQSFEDLQDWLGIINRIYEAKEKAERQEAEKEKKRYRKILKAEIYIVGNKIDLIEYRRVTDRDHNKFIDSEASIIGGFFVSASSGENVLTTFYLVSAKTVGIELSDYELAFTKKVLGVEKRGGDEEGVMKGSEQIQQQDEAAHEDVLNMLKGGGGGSKGGCDCCIS